MENIVISARMKFGQVLGLREKQNFLTPTFLGFSGRFMTPRIRFNKKNFYVRLSFRISGFLDFCGQDNSPHGCRRELVDVSKCWYFKYKELKRL